MSSDRIHRIKTYHVEEKLHIKHLEKMERMCFLICVCHSNKACSWDGGAVFDEISDEQI
jgi:hypothetical protein